jgi:preprotein translocase subunit Sec61beta
MAKEKMNMPMSGAGLTRYFDDYKSKIDFKPGHIIFFALIVVLIVLALHQWGNSLFSP